MNGCREDFVKEVAGFHYGSGTWLNWEGVHAYAAQKELDGTVLQNFLDKAKSMERRGIKEEIPPSLQKKKIVPFNPMQRLHMVRRPYGTGL